MFGMSMAELLVICVILLLLFGHRRILTLGQELGGAIKGFRGAVKDESAAP